MNTEGFQVASDITMCIEHVIYFLISHALISGPWRDCLPSL